MKTLLRKTAKWIHRQLLPPRARNTLRAWLALDQSDERPRLIEDFAAQRVMVLAPHMDDETIGPGATLHKHAASGAKVTAVFMTDGRRGDPALWNGKLDPQERQRRADELAIQRKREALEAAKIIGIASLEFLDAPDGSLWTAKDVVGRLREIMLRVRPQIVYLPSPIDAHDDHWATNRVFFDVLKSMNSQQHPQLVRGYEIWAPLPANRLADVGDVYDVKRRAIAEFTSQTKYCDYLRAAEGLNSYRSIHCQAGAGFAEAFMECTPAQFCALFERIGRQR